MIEKLTMHKAIITFDFDSNKWNFFRLLLLQLQSIMKTRDNCVFFRVMELLKEQVF